MNQTVILLTTEGYLPGITKLMDSLIGSHNHGQFIHSIAGFQILEGDRPSQYHAVVVCNTLEPVP